MNKAKALLDSLMGPSRDVSNKEKSNDEFLESSCCKHYLVGCCPNAILGKKLEAIRKAPNDFCICPGVMFDRPSVINPEGCPKLHSVGLRDQFKQHPKSEKYRREYEDDLRKFLTTVMQEVAKKTVHEKKKREELGRDIDNERMCEVCGMRYKLRRKEWGVEVEDDHDRTDVHRAYVKLQQALEELDAKAKEREAAAAAEDAKAPEDTKTGAGPSKSRERGGGDRASRDSDNGGRSRESRISDRRRDSGERQSRSQRSRSQRGGRRGRGDDSRERARDSGRHRERGRHRDDSRDGRGRRERHRGRR